MKSYLKQGNINQFKMRIRSAYPSISNLEVSYVKDAIKNGWGNKRNLYSDRLIKYFSKYLNLKYILPVINCTSAIHLALLSSNKYILTANSIDNEKLKDQDCVYVPISLIFDEKWTTYI